LKKLKEKKMNLLDIFEGREPYQQAIDKLEQRRIDHLAMKMDDLVARAKDPEYKKNPAALSALMKEFQKCKAERDSYHKIKEGEVTRTATGIKHRGTYGTEYSKSGVEFAKQKHHADLNKVDKTLTKNLEKGMDIKIEEGSMKQWLWNEAERMDRDAFVANADEYGMSAQEAAEWWDDINGVDESGIGQDIVNKQEKMARATPQTKTGAVASTVKNAAKWLAGQGGPGKEGPTYEGAEDIEDRGEYDREGDMAKDNIHTIVRNARELESILGDNDNLPEWVQDKLANIKGMMTAVSEYMQTQQERDSVVPEGTETQWSKQSPWTKIPKNKSGQPVDPRGEVTHLSDVARRRAERNAQAQKKSSKEVKGVAETVTDPRAGMAKIYRELAPKIERYKDSFLAGQLYDELENYAELHGAEAEFRRMMNGARNRAHMEYDTNPGGFHNWFWFLPFADEDVAEMDKSQTPPSRHGDYPLGAKGTTAKPTTPKKVVKSLTKDFEKAFAKEKGVTEGTDDLKKRMSKLEALALALAANRAGDDAKCKMYQQKIQSLKQKLSQSMAEAVNEKGALKSAQAAAKFIIRNLDDRGTLKDYSMHFWSPEKFYQGATMAMRGAGHDEIVRHITQDRPAQFESGVAEGWSDRAVAQRTGRPRTPYSVYIKGRKWKDFANDDLARAVMDKLKTKFAEDGRDPETITIAPTDMAEAKATKTRLDPKCWTGKKIGNPKTKVKGGVRVNNCVPATEDIYMEDEPSPVESAIIRRIMVSHRDWLVKFGPEKVMQAAEEVAYNVGDVDEIGSSDVSAYIHQVGQILGAVA
jgi:hypothetical protein